MTFEAVTNTYPLPSQGVEVSFGILSNPHNYFDAYIDFLANNSYQKIQLRIYGTSAVGGVRSLVGQSDWLIAQPNAPPVRAIAGLKYVSGTSYELEVICIDNTCSNIKASLVGYESQENYLPQDTSTNTVAITGTETVMATIASPHSFFDASADYISALNARIRWSLYATAGAGGVRAKVAQFDMPPSTVANQKQIILQSIGPIGSNLIELVAQSLDVPVPALPNIKASLVGFDPINNAPSVPVTLAGDVSGLSSANDIDGIGTSGAFSRRFTPAATWIDYFPAAVLNYSLQFNGNELLKINVGNISYSFGYANNIANVYSVACGSYMTLGGIANFGGGESLTLTGTNACGLGYSCTAAGRYSAFLGFYCNIYEANGTALGVSCSTNLAGELGHSSGHNGAQGLHAWDVDKTCTAAPGNLVLVANNAGTQIEIEIAHNTLLPMTIKLSGCVAGMGKVACEIIELLIATPAGASVITGVPVPRVVGQSFVSQGWTYTISITGTNTLRIQCDPGADTVRFFARVETSQITP